MNFLGKEVTKNHFRELTMMTPLHLLSGLSNYSQGKLNIALNEIETLYNLEIYPLHNWSFTKDKLPEIFINEEFLEIKDVKGETFIYRAIRNGRLKYLKPALTLEVLLRKNNTEEKEEENAL